MSVYLTTAPSIPIGLTKHSFFTTMIKTTKRQNVGHSVHQRDFPRAVLYSMLKISS